MVLLYLCSSVQAGPGQSRIRDKIPRKTKKHHPESVFLGKHELRNPEVPDDLQEYKFMTCIYLIYNKNYLVIHEASKYFLTEESQSGELAQTARGLYTGRSQVYSRESEIEILREIVKDIPEYCFNAYVNDFYDLYESKHLDELRNLLHYSNGLYSTP